MSHIVSAIRCLIEEDQERMIRYWSENNRNFSEKIYWGKRNLVFKEEIPCFATLSSLTKRLSSIYYNYPLSGRIYDFFHDGMY